MNASKSAAQVFQYLVSLVTIFAVLNWVAILVSYISFKRALRAQGITANMQPYVGYLQPYGAYFSLAISLLVVMFQGKTSRSLLLISGGRKTDISIRLRRLHPKFHTKHLCAQVYWPCHIHRQFRLVEDFPRYPVDQSMFSRPAHRQTRISRDGESRRAIMEGND